MLGRNPSNTKGFFSVRRGGTRISYSLEHQQAEPMAYKV
jgi:hypothetical protein